MNEMLIVSSTCGIHKQTNSLTWESTLCEASYLCHHVATIFLTVAIENCYFNSRGSVFLVCLFLLFNLFLHLSPVDFEMYSSF